MELDSKLPLWMVRSGEGGRLARWFLENDFVALGWDDIGGIPTPVDYDTLRARLVDAYPSAGRGYIQTSAGQLKRFIEFPEGSQIVTYDNANRLYYVGIIASPYRFREQHPEYRHTREVEWISYVRRDALSETTRAYLGAYLTIFKIDADASIEVIEKSDPIKELRGSETFEITDDEGRRIPRKEIENLVRETTREAISNVGPFRNVVAEARSAISDKISDLSWQEVQYLVAGLLRAMGYKTRVVLSKDRGRDIVATVDGTGLSGVSIISEVKHQANKIGPETMRAFTAVPRRGQRGLFVSTSGFSTEAYYEAERADAQIVAIDREFLIDLIIEHYDGFDQQAREILRLEKVYWPAD